jgi:hypothetical protein
VQLADRALGGLGGIGRPHHVAMPEDGIFALQNLHDHRRRDHEVHQLAEERPRLVDRIKGFSLFAGHANALLRNDPQTGLFDQGIDRTRQVSLGRIGLDNRKGAFNRHDFVLESGDGRLRRLYRRCQRTASDQTAAHRGVKPIRGS